MKIVSSLAFAAGLALAVAAPVSAQLATDVPAGTFKIDPTHASVTWKVMHMGLSNYTARFAKVDATLTFDPAKPETSTLTATVDPMSIKTDFPFVEKENFDKVLATSAKWFNAEFFDKIEFKSTVVKMTGAKTADVTGDLTLLGVTKPVVLKVTFNGGMAAHPMSKKPAVGFSATVTVKRSEFGMTANIPFVGDDVAVLIEAEMQGG